MNIKFLGKNIPQVIGNENTEKLSAQIRFVLCSAGAIFSGYLLAIEKISFIICLIQIFSLIAVCVNSARLLFEPKIKSNAVQTYINTLFDILIISLFIWTFYHSGMSIRWIHGILFPSYFIVVVLSALHNMRNLPVAAGLVSIIIYCSISLFYLISKNNIYNISEFLLVFLPGMTALLIVSFLCTLVLHKRTILESEISELEEQFRNLSNTLPLILFRIDMDGRIVWVNTTSSKIKPASSINHLIGKKIQDLFIDSESFKIDKSPIQGTFKVKGINKKIEYVDCTVSEPVHKNSYKVLEGSMVDVTARERVICKQKEMKKQLLQYEKMESLGTLASGMIHDFNNILQTLTDITEEVKSNTNESYINQRMNLISDTLTDARFLISELLALDKKKLPTHERLNVVRFLNEIIPVYRQQLGDLYNIKLNISDDSAWIQGDKNYLKRVFQNFFGNSKDAMPDGGTITVDCSIKRNNLNRKLVVIHFSDTGAGIPGEIADKIFEPFFTTKKKEKGTGLGLALVKRIITMHNGQIFLENTYPHGTTFRIEIPERPEHIEDTDSDSVLLNRQSTSLLILDDDPKMRKILTFFLSDLSYNTFETSSADEGIMILKKNRKEIKILIMDWKLGDYDPHEVIGKYREIVPSLIIIVVSGFQPIKKSIKEMDIYKWITKPYDKKYLDNEIQKALCITEKINV